MTRNTNPDLLENLVQFYRQYCMDGLKDIVIGDAESLYVDFGELVRYDPDVADDLRNHPDQLLDHMEEAACMVDLPTGDKLTGLTVRVYGLNDERVYGPGQIRKEQSGKYVGIRGSLERVTTTSDLPETIVFECQRCGTPNTVPQNAKQSDIQEPHECKGCERQGPFMPDDTHADSEWSDYAKVRLQARPDASGESEGKLPGYVKNDLIDEGGETGLLGRAGEPVTAYGVIRRRQKTGRGENQLLFDHVIEVRAIEFDHDDETVNVEAHRDEFEELAARDDAVDLFAESIAPQLHTTDAWDAAMEFMVAYLFGAPRIDVPNGPTYRGDLHFLMITDYGMGKSTAKEEIEAYSPKCISKSTTALSSGVGLTAAAVKDDFGEGQWTIKPGLLVRANGGHLILDEIDKGPDELTEMNDALEGEQMVDIEKAGQSATYESRTAVMALGNPVNGRFDEHVPVAEQLGISESLLSRFDGIVTMTDSEDEEQDGQVAEAYGKAYTEAQEMEYGDRDEFDQLSRPVPIEVGQAWIKHARENVNPLLRYEQFKELKDWYATEVRQLNKTFAEDGDGSNMPVPATVRELAAAVKMAIAFARVQNRDEVAQQNIERAKNLGKRLIKQNWDGEKFNAGKQVGGDDYAQLKPKVLEAIQDTELFADEIAREIGEPEQRVRSALDHYKQTGDVIERSGRYESA